MPLLSLDNVSVNYGAIQAVRNITFEVNAGEIVTLIGANGAGKSTILRFISRMLKAREGRIWFNGEEIIDAGPDRAVRMGIAQCPEGRQVLARQSVLDNLELGAYVRQDRQGIQQDITRMFERFPILEQRKKQLAGTLSGGEQQMLAMARALMSRPKLLLLDEPSLGLAPLVVLNIFTIIKELNREGVTILLVEQNARLAMQHAHRTYVIEAGQITLSGNSASLLDDERVLHAYLGN